MLASLFVVGVSTGAGVVIWGTLLQRLVPTEMIGRVASFDFFVPIAFMLASIAIADPPSLIVPAKMIFIVAGIFRRSSPWVPSPPAGCVTPSYCSPYLNRRSVR